MTSNSKVRAAKISAKTLWLITASAIFLMAGWYFYTRVRTPGQYASSSDTQTTVARRGDLVLSARGTGTLIAQTDATFGFKTGGQVTQVNVRIGDQVKTGQELAQLDDTAARMDLVEAQQALQELYSAASIATTEQDIAAAQDAESSARAWLGYLIGPDVLNAEENLADAEQKLSEAQKTAQDNPSDAANQKVKESAAKVNFLKDKLNQARMYYENVYLPETFTRYERQGRKQVVVTYIDPYTGKVMPQIDGPSTDDIATARNNYAQAKQIIKDGKNYLETLRTGVIPDGATGAELNNLNSAQLALKNAQAALDNTRLVTPISGVVTAVDLNIGEQGNTSAAITISHLNQPYALDIYLDEANWILAKVGNEVNVTFDLLPGKTFAGSVTLVYPELNTSSDAPVVHILAQLDQSISQNLPVGTGADVEVIGGEANNVVLVPANVVHKNSSGGYEVSVIQNGQVIEQPVETGLHGTAYVEIKSGLDAGTIVATK